MSRTNFHGSKDVRAIEVRLYYKKIMMRQPVRAKSGANGSDYENMPIQIYWKFSKYQKWLVDQN